MLYYIIDIDKSKNQKDFEELKKYPNYLLLRFGKYTNQYGVIPPGNICDKYYDNILHLTASKNPKYEVILEGDITKFYLDCEIKIPEEDDEFIYNLYMLLYNKLKTYLELNKYQYDDIIMLDSSRYLEKEYKISLHVIVNGRYYFDKRNNLLEMVSHFRNYCIDNKDLYDFIDTKPYKEKMQLFRTIGSKSDFDQSKVYLKPFYIQNNDIIKYDKSYIINNLEKFFIKYYKKDNLLKYTFRNQIFKNIKTINNTQQVEKLEERRERENINIVDEIFIPKIVIDYIYNNYSNYFNIIKINKFRFELRRKSSSFCVNCKREHDKQNSYINFVNGILYLYCYQNKNNFTIIYNIYKSIDILYKEKEKQNNPVITHLPSSSSSLPSSSQSKRLLDYDKYKKVVNNENTQNINNLDFSNNNNNNVNKEIKISKKVSLGDAYLTYYINESINLKRNEINGIKKRGKYNKVSDEKKISDTIKKIKNFIKKNMIKDVDIVDKIYLNNRETIKLYSEIYEKYEIKKEIDKNDIHKIQEIYNLDKHINRFINIMSIFYKISKNTQIMNSNLIFSYWNFKNIGNIDIISEILKMI